MPKRRTYVEVQKRQDVESEQRARKEMIRGWEALRAELPVVDAQFIRETREKLRCTSSLGTIDPYRSNSRKKGLDS